MLSALLQRLLPVAAHGRPPSCAEGQTQAERRVAKTAPELRPQGPYDGPVIFTFPCSLTWLLDLDLDCKRAVPKQPNPRP